MKFGAIKVTRLAKLGEFFNFLSEGNVVVKVYDYAYHFNLNKQNVTCDVKRFKGNSQTPETVGENMSVSAISNLVNELIRDSKCEITFTKGVRIKVSPNLQQ